MINFSFLIVSMLVLMPCCFFCVFCFLFLFVWLFAFFWAFVLYYCACFIFLLFTFVFYARMLTKELSFFISFIWQIHLILENKIKYFGVKIFNIIARIIRNRFFINFKFFFFFTILFNLENILIYRDISQIKKIKIN